MEDRQWWRAVVESWLNAAEILLPPLTLPTLPSCHGQENPSNMSALAGTNMITILSQI